MMIILTAPRLRRHTARGSAGAVSKSGDCMKIIDAHIHFSRIFSFEDCAGHVSDVDYSAQGYMSEAAVNGVVRSVCMGLTETTPGGFPDGSLRRIAAVECRFPAGRTTSAGFQRVP